MAVRALPLSALHWVLLIPLFPCSIKPLRATVASVTENDLKGNHDWLLRTCDSVLQRYIRPEPSGKNHKYDGEWLNKHSFALQGLFALDPSERIALRANQAELCMY